MAKRGKRRAKGTGSVREQPVYKRDPQGRTVKDDLGKPIIVRRIWRGSWSGTDCYGVRHVLTTSDERRRACEQKLDELIDQKLDEFERLRARQWVDDKNERMEEFRGTTSEPPENPFPDRPPTLSEFIESCYWKSNYASGQSHGYRQNLKGFVKNHLDKPYASDVIPLGSMPMHEIRLSHLMAFDKSKVGELSPKTRGHILNFLRTVFRYAMGSECHAFTGVRHNIAREYRLARENDLRQAIPKQAVPFHVLDAIRAKAEEAGDHTMVNMIILAELGVRPNAAASLSWKDFNEGLQAFMITGQIKTENGVQVRRPPKNRKAYPVGVLPEDLPTLRRTAEYSEFVCPASRKFPNRPIRHTAWGSRFKKYATAAGFPNVVLYDAKSSLVTSAIEGGFTSDLIAMSLGITSEVVERNYFKQRVEGQREFFAQIRKARRDQSGSPENSG